MPANPTTTAKLAADLHRRGCPATRVESYTTTRPATADRPAAPVQIVRCIDCGAQDSRLPAPARQPEGDET